jgi:hypothetical protein
MPSLLPIVLLTAATAAHAPVCLAASGANAARAQAPGARSSRSTPSNEPVMLTASVTAGWIEGLVTDERNQPVAGAAVTAQGRDLLIIETDRIGRFELRGLPAGTYLLRVQGRGFAASRREFVQVVPSRGTHFDVQLRRAAAPAMAPASPAVMAAGVGLDTGSAGVDPVVSAVTAETPEVVDPASVPHDHSSAAWRLRHTKRSVLRETTTGYENSPLLDDALWADAQPFDLRDWTLGMGRSAASAVLNGTLTGRVQLLTAGTFDQPFEAFTTEDMPAGIAFVHLAGPLSTRTTWGVEAATARGTVTSWFVSGSYATVVADKHGVEVHSSYSRQTTAGASGVNIVPVEDDARSAGGVQIVDHWTLTPRAMVNLGGRYERYDYLQDPGLFSPQLTVSLAPAARTWIRLTAARAMTAPGAEEFVPQAYGSLSLPPQRTFSSIVSGGALVGQETRHLNAAVEQDIASFQVALSYFRQNVNGQLATIFDPSLASGQRRADLGHYAVASVGDFDASGWGVGLSRPVGTHFRGGVEYRVSQVAWTGGDDMLRVLPVAPSAIRPPTERMHDLTMRVDAAAPRTATRFSAACRFNSRFSRAEVDAPSPGSATRFDVQVYQGLPGLNGNTAQVELVFGVRNLLRNDEGIASLYDELLVVRPPTRVVGGVTVMF